MNQWLEDHRVLILAFVGLLIAAAGLTFALRWQPAAPMIIEPPLPTATPPPTATLSPIQVYVSGAVAHPDVYMLPPDAIVRDALDAAGGTVEGADLNRVNLAQPLADGQQVYVPLTGQEATSEPTALPTLSAENPININTATLEDLDRLPGIGPALAQRIIDYRDAHGPFARIQDIQNVSGIGPAKFADIRDFITTQ
jgi:competence protein ComEA